MIINNSKKALAAKIRSSGFVWPDSGKWAIQDKDGEVFVCSGTSVPVRRMGEVNWEFGEPYRSVGILSLGSNWFQCILSRTEYFHLYPAPDADGWIEWNGGECPVERDSLVDYKLSIGPAFACGEVAGSLIWQRLGVGMANIIAYRLHKPEQSKPEFCGSVTRSIPEPESKPTIEQLAADYRNAKDYADRKQQEADAAKADADARLAKLVAAGKVLGLVLSVVAPEPELVITDWRDLLDGDEVSVQHMKNVYSKSIVLAVGVSDVLIQNHAGVRKTVNLDERDWSFIRRP